MMRGVCYMLIFRSQNDEVKPGLFVQREREREMFLFCSSYYYRCWGGPLLLGGKIYGVPAYML